MTKVLIYLHIKKKTGKRAFAPAGFAKNHKIVPFQAIVEGQAELGSVALTGLRGFGRVR